MTDGYRGIFGAFPYAFRQSGSLLFRSYVLVGALAALAVTVLFGAGLVVLVAQTAALPVDLQYIVYRQGEMQRPVAACE